MCTKQEGPPNYYDTTPQGEWDLNDFMKSKGVDPDAGLEEKVAALDDEISRVARETLDDLAEEKDPLDKI